MLPGLLLASGGPGVGTRTRLGPDQKSWSEPDRTDARRYGGETPATITRRRSTVPHSVTEQARSRNRTDALKRQRRSGPNSTPGPGTRFQFCSTPTRQSSNPNPVRRSAASPSHGHASLRPSAFILYPLSSPARPGRTANTGLTWCLSQHHADAVRDSRRARHLQDFRNAHRDNRAR